MRWDVRLDLRTAIIVTELCIRRIMLKRSSYHAFEQKKDSHTIKIHC